ncbi:MAG: hypothetical protein DRQ47_08245 [Gammaproteobacteria bacterium]|nr:MAG: hypothetical protein DRQ47_08245 [Gammaproteobacteria bacterium]
MSPHEIGAVIAVVSVSMVTMGLLVMLIKALINRWRLFKWSRTPHAQIEKRSMEGKPISKKLSRAAQAVEAAIEANKRRGIK